MSIHAAEVERIPGAATRTFLNVWIALLFMTGVEVFLACFMHLKFERRSLFLTLFPMLILCIMLMLLLFMPDSSRLMMMRSR